MTKSACKDLGTELYGNASVGISGEVDLGHNLMKERDATFIAGVILHELMHNRGFDHVKTRLLSSLHTVPEQARACLTGNPNPWPRERRYRRVHVWPDAESAGLLCGRDCGLLRAAFQRWLQPLRAIRRQV